MSLFTTYLVAGKALGMILYSVRPRPVVMWTLVTQTARNVRELFSFLCGRRFTSYVFADPAI